MISSVNDQFCEVRTRSREGAAEPSDDRGLEDVSISRDFASRRMIIGKIMFGAHGRLLGTQIATLPRLDGSWSKEHLNRVWHAIVGKVRTNLGT